MNLATSNQFTHISPQDYQALHDGSVVRVWTKKKIENASLGASPTSPFYGLQKVGEFTLFNMGTPKSEARILLLFYGGSYFPHHASAYWSRNETLRTDGLALYTERALRGWLT